MTVCETALIKYCGILCFTGEIIENWWKKLNKSKITDQCATSPHRAVHVARAAFVNEVCQILLQTDRWTGRLTDNGDGNVAGDTPSVTSLRVLSQPLVPSPIKRCSLNSLSLFPAMMDAVGATQELLISGNMFLNLSSSTCCDDSVVCLITCWCGCLNQSASLSASLFRKWASNGLVRVCVFCGMVSPRGSVRGFRSEVVERREVVMKPN